MRQSKLIIKQSKLNPEDDIAQMNLGWSYYCANDFQKCINCFMKVIELDENNVHAKFNLAISTLRLGKVDEAYALYREILQGKSGKKYKYPGRN